MGVSFSGEAYSSLAERCLRTLQKDGFQQFASKSFLRGKWAAISDSRQLFVSG